jgi:hypothetical protein
MASFRPDAFGEEMANETADNPMTKVVIMRFRSMARFPSWKSQRKAVTNLCRSDNRISVLMNLVELLACSITNHISKSFSLASVPSVHAVFGGYQRCEVALVRDGDRRFVSASIPGPLPTQPPKYRHKAPEL